jgi:hypothetical protein
MLWYSKGGNPEIISKDNPYDSPTWFDFYSFPHMAITAFIYGLIISFIALFGKLTEKTILYGFILANVVHCVDEILNNVCNVSLEATYYKFQGIHNQKDRDSWQNSLGDLISCLVGTSIIMFVALFSKSSPYCILLASITLFLSCLFIFWIFHGEKSSLCNYKLNDS